MDDLRLLEISSRNQELQMWVSDRVFSTTRLDPGTTQLLKAIPVIPNAGRILDLGCGWGPVATLVAKEAPAAEVWATDVNPQALALTARNAQINGAKNVIVLPAEQALARAQSLNLRFDTIISNPPVRIGKKAMQQMLQSWLDLLAEEGTAWLVMSKNLGADSLIKWLNETGFSAKKYVSRKGFRVIQVKH